MTPRHRSAILIAALALAGAVAAAVFWQPVAKWLHPAPIQVVTEKLTIAVINTYVGSGLVLIAADQGFFAAEGLEVTLQPHAAGRTALAAVLKR